MKICVVGLWHLGSVTAACLADHGHDVIGLDFEADVIAGLRQGGAPLHEPGLDELLAQGIAARSLTFTDNAADALLDAAVVWITYDTPVDDDDRADTQFVTDRVERLFPYLRDGTVVVISSQLPVGSTRRLARSFATVAQGRACGFACSPENLRLGAAIRAFNNPGRIVVGTDDDTTRAKLASMVQGICDNIVWTGIESAEMIKHAINAFLATSIVFANEIAAVCEMVGADARDVAHGLKSESRIGPGAYVSPGGPFAGGTLARDIAFLDTIGTGHGMHLTLLGAVKPSNDWHKDWARRQLREALGALAGQTIAILGLAYKVGTDTLRRSAAIELAQWLIDEGARVQAYDPLVTSLPAGFARITCAPGIDAALQGASATVLTIDTSEFRAIDWRTAATHMAQPILIDPAGIARENAMAAGLRYITVGFVASAAA